MRPEVKRSSCQKARGGAGDDQVCWLSVRCIHTTVPTEWAGHAPVRALQHQVFTTTCVKRRKSDAQVGGRPSQREQMHMSENGMGSLIRPRAPDTEVKISLLTVGGRRSMKTS